MSGMMKKYCVGILLCVILSGCVNNVHVRAAEEEIRDTPVPANEQEYGILVIECVDGGGTIEISCGDMKENSNCDYYEMEIPLGEEVTITIHPYAAYELKSVKLGDNLLKSQDGQYKMIMTESYMTLLVTYGASPNDENGSDSESTDNKVHHSGGDEESGNSVNSISYDVVVTYLDADNHEVTDISSVPSESSDVVEDIVTGNEELGNIDSGVDSGNDTAGAEIAYDTSEAKSEEADTETLVETSESIESADTDVKTEKDDTILEPTGGTVAGLGKIAVNSKEEFDNSLNTEEKSVLILSNFPLYLVLVCCMIIVKRIIWMKKVEMDG